MGRPRVITDADLADMGAAYQRGASIRELARLHGITYYAMHRRLTNAGVTFRQRTGGRPRKPNRSKRRCPMAEPLDLAPIKARYVESDDCVDWTFSDPWEVIADVPLMVAELEKTRRERDSLARRCAVRFEETEKLRAEVEAHEGELGDLRSALSAAEAEVDGLRIELAAVRRG